MAAMAAVRARAGDAAVDAHALRGARRHAWRTRAGTNRTDHEPARERHGVPAAAGHQRARLAVLFRGDVRRARPFGAVRWRRAELARLPAQRAWRPVVR